VVGATNLTNGNLNVWVDPVKGIIKATRISDGQVLLQSNSIPAFTAFNPGGSFTPPYPLYAFSFSYNHAPGKIYGMGAHRQSELEINNFVRDFSAPRYNYQPYLGTDINIPYYTSEVGFQFLWNLPSYGTITQNDYFMTWTSTAGCQLDFWVSTTPAVNPYNTVFKPLVRTFSEVAGRPNPIPYWATGFWHSKNRLTTDVEVAATIAAYQAYGSQVSSIALDFYNWLHKGDFSLNVCYSNMTNVANYASSALKGARIMASVWPHVETASTNYAALNAMNGFATDLNNNPIQVTDFSFTGYIYDPFKTAVRQFVWNQLITGYVNNGVKGFWLDATEPELDAGSFAGNLFYGGRSEKEVGMLWPVYHAKTVYDGWVSMGLGADRVTQVRSTWFGGASLNTLIWSGDSECSFQDMRSQILQVQMAQMSGIYWYTNDAGGFWVGKHGDPMMEELMVRWFQFNAFLPVFRVHGFRKDVNGNDGTSTCSVTLAQAPGLETAPWSWQHADILLTIMNIRESLRPYIQQYLNETVTNGVPLVRMMCFEFPDIECANAQDQYMFGPNYLVAPVFAQGMTQRAVYLPAGYSWQYYFNPSIEYQGGGYVVMNTSLLTQFPLFVKVPLVQSDPVYVTASYAAADIFIPLQYNFLDVNGVDQFSGAQASNTATFTDNQDLNISLATTGRGSSLEVLSQTTFAMTMTETWPATFTVNFWVYSKMPNLGISKSATQSDMQILSAVAGLSSGNTFTFGVTTANQQIFTGDVDGTNKARMLLRIGSGTNYYTEAFIRREQWQMVTLTFNSAISDGITPNTFVYIDGEPQTTMYISPTAWVGATRAAIQLGGYYTPANGISGANSLIGNLQYFSIWNNVVLTTPSVRQLYNDQLPRPPAAVLAFQSVTYNPPYMSMPFQINMTDVTGTATVSNVYTPSAATFADNGAGRGSALYIATQGSFSILYSTQYPRLFTVTMWLYDTIPPTLTGSGAYVLSSDCSLNQNNGFWVEFDKSRDPGLRDRIVSWIGNAGNDNGPVPYKQWFRVAIVMDTSVTDARLMNFHTYVNGQAVGQSFRDPSSGGWGASSPPGIGVGGYVNSHGGSGTSSWVGYIQNVKIYNYAMTPAQVLASYTAEKM